MSATSQPRRLPILLGATLASALLISACSAGSVDGDSVRIDFLVGNEPYTIALGEALADAFMAENPGVVITVDSRPGGGDGDNLVKTRLATGEMADVFIYNTGSLFEALNPDQFLVDLSDQPWVDDLEEDFLSTVSTDAGVYGNSWGASFAGGIIYNRGIYEDLGLEIPESWEEFMANNAVIADAGITPVIQTYGSTWTSQLFVLGDFANVLAADPDWAQEYTAGNRKYAEEPALYAFLNHQEVYEAGYFNENYPSATDADGARMIAEGEGAHYPWLTNLLTYVEQNTPDLVDDIGYFALPARDSAHTQATIWQASGLYIPQSTEGAARDAAIAFVEFVGSDTGCALQNEHLIAAGPFPGTCDLPADAPPMLADVEAYVDAGRAAPALEFLSPIKGPNLEHILVEVGSGIRSGADGAAYYDQDVVNQARQLGLEGW